MRHQAEQASLEWDPALSTGVATLDEQHRALFACVSTLEKATAEKSLLGTFHALEQLSNYVGTHFAEEEFLMRVHDFPGMTDHVREHRDFTNRLHQLRRIHLERDISSDLIAMLRDWLTQHVAHTDMAYVPYLTADRRLALTRPPLPAQRHGRQTLLESLGSVSLF